MCPAMASPLRSRTTPAARVTRAEIPKIVADFTVLMPFDAASCSAFCWEWPLGGPWLSGASPDSCHGRCVPARWSSSRPTTQMIVMSTGAGVSLHQIRPGAGHRLTTLGAVTGSTEQPSLGDGGLLREIGAGQWYWAHRSPGPYLLAATTAGPVRLTVVDRPGRRGFGLPGIECADRVGLCTLDVHPRTLERVALPDVPDTRWATPTTAGCGLWGLAGAGGDLRLIIQQRDGSFASADIPEDRAATGMAEGGPHCEIAYYQGIADNRDQLVVSLDQGRTWQIRQTPLPQEAGYLEQQPRLRELLPPRWRHLPAMAHPLGPPGSLHPL